MSKSTLIIHLDTIKNMRQSTKGSDQVCDLSHVQTQTSDMSDLSVWVPQHPFLTLAGLSLKLNCSHFSPNHLSLT